MIPLLLLASSALAQVPVVIETTMGAIHVELDDKHAPGTTANFLKYVDAGHFQGGRFHRTVKTNPDNQPQSAIKIEVIQGGVNPDRKDQGFGAIKLERTTASGLKHRDGTISMARFQPDSAVSDFFICIGDQPSLDFGGQRNPDGQGFAAFGKVTQGMEIVRKIQAAPSGAGHDGTNPTIQRLTPPVAIVSVTRRK
ncbi:MAG: peptidylprolyl isomerase [Acidobacteria bacterium]|nr:peptidylprolyl isomerase [Acidobacteriota bacterium]